MLTGINLNSIYLNSLFVSIVVVVVANCNQICSQQEKIDYNLMLRSNKVILGWKGKGVDTEDEQVLENWDKSFLFHQIS